MTPRYTDLSDRSLSEASLLLAISDDPKRILDVHGIITPADFLHPEFAAAFGWMMAFSESNRKISLYTLHQAHGSDPQWKTFLESMNNLTQGYALPHMAVDYARDIRGHSRRAQALHNISRLQAMAQASRSFDEVADGVQDLFDATCSEQATGRFRKASDIVPDLRDKLDNPSTAPRFRTGFPSLDELLKGGFRGGQLVIVGGRTGGGKTVLAMNMGVQMALDGFPVAAFSLEMSDTDLIARCIMSEGVHRSGEEAWSTVEALPLWVDATSNVTVRSLSARLKIMASRKGVKIFIVDYLQLIGTEGGSRDSRERLVADMSRRLKIAAKENDVLVIALSQLNEAGELRESRAIEQDADAVIQVIDDDDGNFFLRVCKQRGGKAHGPRARVKDEGDPGIPVRFHAENFRFSER